MERNIDKTLIQCNDVSGLAEKACGALERANGVVGNAGVLCKLTGETDHSSLSHIMDIKTNHAKAASSELNPINANLQPPFCDEAPRMLPASPPSSSQVFPFTAFGGIPLLNDGNLGSGHLSYGNGVMGASGCILKPFHLQPNNLNVQLSEVCQPRFVMFDHSGTKRRMIFHPAMINMFSASFPSSLQTAAMYNLGPLPGKCGIEKDTNLARSTLPACPLYDCHHSHLLPTCAALNSISSASDNCDTPLLAEGAKFELNHSDGSPELSCFSHENTEDLEALLSSDEDEVSSTGHSPSDLTRNKSSKSSPSNSEAHTLCNSKRRKRELEAHMDDDTCSTATSGDKLRNGLSSQKLNIADTNLTHIKEGLVFHEATFLRPMGYDSMTLDMLFPDEASSSGSANNQGASTKLPASLPQLQEQHPAEQSRKEKIKRILRLLRGIIPGGETMDTAFVLDEAIQYVRTLQFEVQKLQARKLV